MPSYGMNQALYGRTLATIRYPAECVAMGDSCHPMGGDWRMAWPQALSVLPGSGNPCTVRTNAAAREASTVHNGGSNLAMCDGHAKWMKGDAIYDNGSGKYFNP